MNHSRKYTKRNKIGERERERESIGLFCHGQLGRNRGGVEMK